MELEPIQGRLNVDHGWCDLDALMTEGQAAAFLGFKVKTLQKWRVTGCGPVYISVSRRSVRYQRRGLIAWINARLRISTSDTGQGR